MEYPEIIRLMEDNEWPNKFVMKELLISIADQILKNPDNLELRTLKKSDERVNRRILMRAGGPKILRLMGFHENSDGLTLPYGETYITQLTKVKEDLEKWEPIHREVNRFRGETRVPRHSFYEIPLKPMANILPPFKGHLFQNPFLRKITETFHQAQVYADPTLQVCARDEIPMEILEKRAQNRMRDIQRRVKNGMVFNDDITMHELLLVELLQWFKEDFFTWVDAPDCEHCGETTKFSHISTDEKLMVYTKRVEMYKCTKCEQFTPFPRYQDLHILLATRKGRCGEWANVFTLMCFALGWEARYVVDETDHVWTEVWSLTKERWLHCDPCENVFNSPLMYEHGWKKKLTYVMAYSPDQLQDVTWRYSNNHKAVIARRNLCSEAELVKAIWILRKRRMERTLSDYKLDYFAVRVAEELALFFEEREPRKEELLGRSSGALDWRLERGELSGVDWKPTDFRLFDDQLEYLQYVMRYSCASDRYEVLGRDEVFITHWYNSVNHQENIMRKEERDWKQVYLCRTEGCEGVGRIVWKFTVKDTQKRIESVLLRMQRTTFEDGKVSIDLYGEDKNTVISLPPENQIETKAFKGSQCLVIEARLEGGKGTEAWQHAQLFRQPIDSTEYPFELLLNFEGLCIEEDADDL